MADVTPNLKLLLSEPWQDYELLDSGEGNKLERFGRYTFVRPEPQAMWKRSLPVSRWSNADAVFHGSDSDEETGSKWEFRKQIPPRWEMKYRDIRFWVEATPFRHLGVFPEHAAQWNWMIEKVKAASQPVKVLNLFAYTGISSLVLAQAGAQVTHVDASKKIVAWARENQGLSKLEERPIRWIIDDALKFVRREGRRGTKYDAILIDPPKFGRGPKGEIWKLHESLPALLEDCRAILSPNPLFTILTTYAVKVSPLSLHYLLQEMMSIYSGDIEVGEMVAAEQSAKRLLSIASYGRWSAT